MKDSFVQQLQAERESLLAQIDAIDTLLGTVTETPPAPAATPAKRGRPVGSKWSAEAKEKARARMQAYWAARKAAEAAPKRRGRPKA